MFDALVEGLQFFDAWTILWLIGGLLLGAVFGVLPGLGSVSGMSVVLPLTYGMSPIAAFALLCGIYIGSVWGGSVTAIMLRIPGDAGSIATVFDGYELTRQGRSRFALGISISASVIGGVLGSIALVLLLPVFGVIATNIDAAAYFWIIVIALVFVAQSVKGNVRRGLISATFGLMLGTIGIDPIVSQTRYTFGEGYLFGGLPLIPLVLGLFGIAHMLQLAQRRSATGAGRVASAAGDRIRDGLIVPLKHWVYTTRATLIGIFSGAVPGLGASSGNLIAYTDAERKAGASGRFGHGDPRGLIAPEASNNATVSPSMVPTLSLGVPGTVSAAVFMGALVLHGLQPGRELVRDHADSLVAIVVLLVLGNIVLLPTALASAGSLARINQVPTRILVPAIIVLLTFGAFASRQLTTDVAVMIIVGVIAYFMERFGFPGVPLLIAFILGPILEVNLRRALVAGDGSVLSLAPSPVHWLLILALVALIGGIIYRSARRPRTSQKELAQ